MWAESPLAVVGKMYVLVLALHYKNYINTRMCCCVAIQLVIIIKIKYKNYDVRSWSS